MKLKIAKAEIKPYNENGEKWFELYVNGELKSGHTTNAEAEKALAELKQTIVLRTRKVGYYFRGVIMEGHFPSSGKMFFVACKSYAGGSKIPLLSIIEFRCKTEAALLQRLKTFKKKFNLVSSRS